MENLSDAISLRIGIIAYLAFIFLSTLVFWSFSNELDRERGRIIGFFTSVICGAAVFGRLIGIAVFFEPLLILFPAVICYFSLVFFWQYKIQTGTFKRWNLCLTVAFSFSILLAMLAHALAFLLKNSY